MTSIVFTQFSDDLPVDPNKEYYISPIYKDTGLQEIHKLCLFPSKISLELKKYLAKLEKTDIGKYINVITTDKWTPLMIASRNGVTESVKLLLKNESSQAINLQNNNGLTALMLVCRYCNNIECVKLLLEYEADINVQNKYGWTALMMACYFCNTDSNIQCVKLLLEYGADINLQDEDGWSALMLICRYCKTDGDMQCVKLLLNYGADINNSYKTNISTTTNTILLNINDVSRKLIKFDYNSILLFEMKKCVFSQAKLGTRNEKKN